MKLPDFLLNGHMNSLRFAMGASLSSTFRMEARFKPIEVPEIERRLMEVGVDVSLSDIQILEDGTLAYEGYRVLVYIRDISVYGDERSLPRYHLALCKTLDSMRQANRWGRYVVANRDDGRFVVNTVNESNASKVLSLNVCQNCLGTIAWDGFSFDLSSHQRKLLVGRFALPEFFVRYPRDLIAAKPAHSSDTAPVNDYPDNWGDISERRKAALGYRCQQCPRTLSLKFSRFLHVHHQNGLKNDCREENLEVLCIGCHANQPMHGHMKSLPDYKEFMALFPTSGGPGRT